MPTGYTAAIADGIAFEQFVMMCARGMGALIMMRDEPPNAPIPERFEPSDYNARKLEEANAALARLRAMSHDEATAAAQAEFADECAAHAEAIKRDKALREKYEAMLEKVKGWKPPTPDHQGLKNFMFEQINESIRFDCDDRYELGTHETPKQKTGEAWLAGQIAKELRNVEYHARAHAEEVERTEARNRWISALRSSLNT